MALSGLAMDIILIILAIIIAYILFKLLKSVKTLVVNMIIGFLLIIVTNRLVTDVDVPIWNLATIVITALTGALGALVLIVLNLFGRFPF